MTRKTTQKKTPTQRPLTTKDLEVVFNVTTMTVYNWRQGSATREPLPVIESELEKGNVRFDPKVTARWANKHGITIAPAPQQSPLIEGLIAYFTPRPGPKPKAHLAPRGA